MGKTAFVTGGTGFVGSHLVEALLQRGYTEVRCLVRKDLKWLEGLAITPIHGSLHDQKVLAQAVRGVDYVYHVAGVTRAQKWEVFEQGNIQGTLNLLDAVKGSNPDVKKVLVTSTLEAVGPCENGIATEDMALRPVTQYGRSKAYMEQSIAERGYAAAFPLVIVRPPSVYGPREADIYTFFQTVQTGIAPVLGDGDKVDLSLVHARDLVRGMIDAAENEQTAGNTYFIGSETNYSWNALKTSALKALGGRALTISVPVGLVQTIGAVTESIGKLFGKYPPFNREKAKAARYTCKMCAVEKAKRDFGYEQRIPLDEGIAETIAWYRTKGWLK